MTQDYRIRVGDSWTRFGKVPIGVNLPTPPDAPTNLAAPGITDTTITLTWTLSTSPGVTAQRIYMNNTLFATVANGTATSYQATGLTPGTPYTWKMTAYNATLGMNSGFSNSVTATTTTPVILNGPNVPQSFAAAKTSGSPTNSITAIWSAPVVDASHPAHTGYRVFLNGTQVGGNLPASSTGTTMGGLVAGASYAVTVKAFNANGESASTSAIVVQLDSPSSGVFRPLMGCSTSDRSHGNNNPGLAFESGTANDPQPADNPKNYVWEGWRTYNLSTAKTFANRTGANHPKFLAMSLDGPNIGSNTAGSIAFTYNDAYNIALSALNDFYYNGTGNTLDPVRGNVKVFFSNGNENSLKGSLNGNNGTLPQNRIDSFVTSQKALFDACHLVVGGVRRFPLAYAGSNPTQNHELAGDVQVWLHPSARYHDFVMWSMYPPGRENTSTNPTYNWPSFLESERNDRQLGFLTRCFYRTAQARAAARAATGDNNFQLMIGTGEIGTGDIPGHPNARPYYVVHGLYRGMRILSAQYSLEMAFSCWWDNQTDINQSQNVLDDEPDSVNPSTREAWQNAHLYDHTNGGTHPASWTGLPASIPSGNKTGPVV